MPVRVPTAWARSRAPIFASMWLTWLSTVASLTTRRSAISALDRPAAMSVRTSASRGVRPSGSGAGMARRASRRQSPRPGATARPGRGRPGRRRPGAGPAGSRPRPRPCSGSRARRPQRVQDPTVVGVGGQHDFLDRGIGSGCATRRMAPIGIQRPISRRQAHHNPSPLYSSSTVAG